MRTLFALLVLVVLSATSAAAQERSLWAVVLNGVQQDDVYLLSRPDGVWIPIRSLSEMGLRNFEAAALPGMFEISVALGRESLAVGTALGYRIEPIFGLRADEFAGSSDENLVTAMKTLLGHVGGGRTAPIHDHLKGRISEMEFIPGVVSRKGRELGIPTPANDAVVALDRMINRGELAMDPSNFERLQAMLAATSRR
jgi:hypothetical protein